jgi:prefoldin subunit 5
MNSNELKELVKQHFSLVEASAEKFGELMDINKAFTLLFPGDVLEVGSEVKVRTEEGQELTAPDGYHELENGMMIKVESGKVTEISTAAAEGAEGEELKEMTPVEGEINDKVGFEEVVVDAPAEVAPIVEEVAKAVIEAVKGEITELKAELASMKKKMAELEDAPATTKAEPETMSKDKTIKTETEAFNKDRFAKVMERFSK